MLTALLTVALLAGGCASDSSTELLLRDGLSQEIQGFSGIAIADDEALCLNAHLSKALGISYPATWSDYKQAMNARLATIVSAIESSGEVTTDPLPGEAMTACLTAPHLDAAFAVSLVPPARWSDLTDAQRSCLLERTQPYQRSIPQTGIDQAELKTACNIP